MPSHSDVERSAEMVSISVLLVGGRRNAKEDYGQWLQRSTCKLRKGNENTKGALHSTRNVTASERERREAEYPEVRRDSVSCCYREEGCTGIL